MLIVFLYCSIQISSMKKQEMGVFEIEAMNTSFGSKCTHYSIRWSSHVVVGRNVSSDSKLRIDTIVIIERRHVTRQIRHRAAAVVNNFAALAPNVFLWIHKKKKHTRRILLGYA